MSEWKPTSLQDALKFKKVNCKGDFFWRILAVIGLVAFCVLGYLNVTKGRYKTFYEGDLIIDSCTGRVYLVEECINERQK